MIPDGASQASQLIVGTHNILNLGDIRKFGNGGVGWLVSKGMYEIRNQGNYEKKCFFKNVYLEFI